MVQLNILSGKMAGASWSTRRFPVHIGRSAKADLQIEENGIWDDHLQLDLNPAEGFRLRTQANALATVNGQPANEALLRNGDLIQIGPTRIQFWLSETHQRGLRPREWLTWAGIAAICLGQVALVYWLLR
jgi:pSer/pThr/pTyr-binding forkhead associated (FHA) protein